MMVAVVVGWDVGTSGGATTVLVALRWRWTWSHGLVDAALGGLMSRYLVTARVYQVASFSVFRSTDALVLYLDVKSNTKWQANDGREASG